MTDEPPVPHITVPPEWISGAYANVSFVLLNPREVTLDFVRMDPWDPAAHGVVVARVALAFEAANDLAVSLASELQAWALAAMSDSGEDGNGQTLHRPEDPDTDPSS